MKVRKYNYVNEGGQVKRERKYMKGRMRKGGSEEAGVVRERCNERREEREEEDIMRGREKLGKRRGAKGRENRERRERPLLWA